MAHTLYLNDLHLETVVFYCARPRLAYVALVLRALQMHTIVTWHCSSSVDWNVSDSYLHPQREDQGFLNAHLQPKCKFEPWSSALFSRIVIYV